MRHLDLSAATHFGELQEDVEKSLQKVKDESPEEWYKFCEEVHTYHRPLSRRVWSARGPLAPMSNAV